MKKWIKIGGGLAAAILIVGIALYYVSDLLATFAMTVPLAAHPNVTPANLGFPYETVSTVSSDGLHLKGWWIPAADPNSKKAPVVIVHGLGAGKEFMLGFVTFTRGTGRGTLVIDLRGHGESDPSPTTLGAREPLDLKAWIDFLKAKGLPRPILWGTSLGAVTVLRAAADNPDIAGVIADAPFDTLRHTMAVHARLYFNLPEFPLVPLTAWQFGRRLHFRVDDIDSRKTVTHIHVPLLVMAAENDRRMSLPSIQSIYGQANEPKRFFLIKGDDHETRHFAPEFRDAVASFLDLCEAEEAKRPAPAP